MAEHETGGQGRWRTAAAICACSVLLVAAMAALFDGNWRELFLFFAIPIAGVGALLLGWLVAPQFGRGGASGILRSVVVGLLGPIFGAALGGFLFALLTDAGDQGAGLVDRLAGAAEFGGLAAMFPLVLIAENPAILGVVAVCIFATHWVGRRQHRTASPI